MTSPPIQPARWLIHIQQILTIIFLIYVLILLGRSAWQNVESNRRMTALREEITTLRLKNAYLENLIVYEQTDSFKELEARQKLNLQKPGEIVVNLPKEATTDLGTTHTESQSGPTQLPIELWWAHFFG